MPEPLFDFQCRVGKYEIRRFDELPEKTNMAAFAAEIYGSSAAEFLQSDFDAPPDAPYLLQVGPAKSLRPSRKILDYAVGLLMQTEVSALHRAQGDRWSDIRKRLKSATSRRKELSELDKIRNEPINFNPYQLSTLKRNVLAIARCIGMLNVGEGIPDRDEFDSNVTPCESLHNWIAAANTVQLIFSLRTFDEFDLPPQVIAPHDHLSLLLSNRPVRLHIQPSSTRAALIYHAAQMVAQGTTSRTCNKCDKPFLEGGERDPRNKKRAGSRFCSDKCRYEFHNQARRKAKATSS
ncbi:hypothetical protein [Bradyrhizobium sp. RT10b]|uniref:hypothetical protein n=1 Tax=Bradyrhizobium sp. RT10b TaxID=3156331 RepID=UPI0033924D54